MRAFEATSFDRLSPTDRIDNGLEDFFTDKKTPVAYDDYDNLVTKVAIT